MIWHRIILILACITCASSAAAQKPTKASFLAPDEARSRNKDDSHHLLEDVDFGNTLFSLPLLDVTENVVLTTLYVRLAMSDAEHRRGLMHEAKNSSHPCLPDNEGMLFLFPENKKQVLWMRDTYMPLDAAWFSQDGVLLEKVGKLQPLDETWVWSTSHNVRFELETNQNFFDENNLNRPGEVKLDVNKIREAVISRNYDPDVYVPLHTSRSLEQGGQEEPRSRSAKDALNYERAASTPPQQGRLEERRKDEESDGEDMSKDYVTTDGKIIEAHVQHK